LPGINPISQNILAFYPLPNAGNTTFVTTLTKPQNEDQFGLRLDHYLTAKDTFNFRYSFSQGSVTDPLSTSGANVPDFPSVKISGRKVSSRRRRTLFRRLSWAG